MSLPNNDLSTTPTNKIEKEKSKNDSDLITLPKDVYNRLTQSNELGIMIAINMLERIERIEDSCVELGLFVRRQRQEIKKMLSDAQQQPQQPQQ